MSPPYQCHPSATALSNHRASRSAALVVDEGAVVRPRFGGPDHSLQIRQILTPNRPVICLCAEYRPQRVPLKWRHNRSLGRLHHVRRRVDEGRKRQLAGPAGRQPSTCISGKGLLSNGHRQNALGRLDRDLLPVSRVNTVVVLEGINDITGLAHAEVLRKPIVPADHAQLVGRIEMTLQQMSGQAPCTRTSRIGAIILPFMGSAFANPTAVNEADRARYQRTWIRQSRQFDAVVDLDAVARDSKDPTRLNPEFDYSDHFALKPAGYRVMADAVPEILAKIP